MTVMKEYGQENLAKLLVEKMHSYLHETIITSLVLESVEGKEISDSEY
jgi:hypothetical protein